jgi:sugar transferase (PEP-CTERM/EpsH1 system associated)
MRILCLTSRLPYPPNRGDRLRAFHFLEHLSRDHELVLLSFIAHEHEREHIAALREYCHDVQVVPMSPRRSAATVAGNLWRRQPLQTLYYRSRRMDQLVAEALSAADFQAAYVHLFRMAPYVADYPDLYRIVDLTDVISKEIGLSLSYRGLASRLVYRLEGPRVARYEAWVAQHFEETWLISEADRQILATACPDANIQVIPNGVDTDSFQPLEVSPAQNRLIFVGHLRVFHNIDAAHFLVRDILPLVRQEVPDCTLQIVGADPDPTVHRLGQAPGVTVTGFVPDLNDYLNRATVFAAPLRFSAGVQNKVLEAMAAGRPVVTTRPVCQGLGSIPERDLLVGDDAQAIAAQLVRLLRNEGLRDRLGQAGRAFVANNYSWKAAVERMGAIEKMLSTSSPLPDIRH